MEKWTSKEMNREYTLHDDNTVTAVRTDFPEEYEAPVEAITGRVAERLADRVIWTSRHRGSDAIPQAVVDWAFSIVKKDYADTTGQLLLKLDKHVNHMQEDDMRLASWACEYLRRAADKANHRAAVSYMMDAVEVLLDIKEADDGSV